MSKSKRLAAGSMGYGRRFYPDEPEDLAYLKKLAKDTRGDENRWPELNLRICGRPFLRDGEPCSHPGCLNHLSHPCEGCGRIGRYPVTGESREEFERDRMGQTGEDNARQMRDRHKPEEK
jgi:hypothetical protein